VTKKASGGIMFYKHLLFSLFISSFFVHFRNILKTSLLLKLTFLLMKSNKRPHCQVRVIYIKG